TGKRVVAVMDGFEVVERAIGFAGLAGVRDALLARDRVAYLFVGSSCLAGLFGRTQMLLYGLADVAESAGADRARARQPPVAALARPRALSRWERARVRAHPQLALALNQTARCTRPSPLPSPPGRGGAPTWPPFPAARPRRRRRPARASSPGRSSPRSPGRRC